MPSNSCQASCNFSGRSSRCTNVVRVVEFSHMVMGPSAGYGYDELAKDNPGLLYYSARGFLSGPYEQRTALDEVAQMMGGLAYMTGPPGQPLRAGASVIDVMGGMFGVIGILSALEMRRRSGRGQRIDSALFESTAFLVG